MSRILAGFRFMLASRGWRRGCHRAWLIWRRFGFTHRRMVKNLRCLQALLEKYDVGATFFVPATVLRDHRRVLEPFVGGRIEWGVHSDEHTDLSRMTPSEQSAHIENAVSLFEQAGVAFTGFRAPYLKTNETTARLLEEAGVFVYDSSPCVLWDEIYGADAPHIAFVGEFYQPLPVSQHGSDVTRDGDLVRIPVSLPDDDILVDRDRRTPEEVGEIWLSMLEAAHAAGQIFVLQLHPERGCELEVALDRLLERARELSMWTPTLGDVAARSARGESGWPAPHGSAFCVTGDLDAMAVRDFAARLRNW